MSNEVRNLEPRQLWNNFADLNAVPRGSKKEERVIQFMVNFGEDLGLETKVDDVGNVIIKKPASKGMEDRQTVVLQSHLDMVHQKNADTDFDFDKEGIRMTVDGDWVKAEGTTLGADNGIGVATIMTILASEDVPHPPIEALFTIDEETGMTGAIGLKGGLLSGDILLNLDTEDDDELTIGCAGGIDVTASGTYEEVSPKNDVALKVSITGLTGGHSGMDIHLGRANANKLMNRVLWELSRNIELEVASVDGGGLRNAIPRESFSVITIPENQVADVEESLTHLGLVLKSEYKSTDPEITLAYGDAEHPDKVISKADLTGLLNAVYACPVGIYRMSPDVEDLVQTSNNLARVEIKDGKFSILCLTRSSVDTEKMDLANMIRSVFDLIGAEVTTSGSYPGWTPKPDAPIIKLMSTIYEEVFEEEPKVYACHAGLECGILGTHYPDMDMISFGPNIRGAHSPDEKAQISSVQKFWKYFLETMKRIPAK
ncbi:MAG: aminoacyl-histidine dipeptidase [Saprospiraceae bacterium]|nr:aminoacyl-histidine dipeptidase [Saprospiraceae bacterium]